MEKPACDRCGEVRETKELDMYYHVEHWCEECIEESTNREPDYDVESADEKHQKAWEEHRKLH